MLAEHRNLLGHRQNSPDWPRYIVAPYKVRQVLTISESPVSGRFGPAAFRTAILPVALAVLLAAGLAVQMSTYLNHDVAYLLYTVGQLLDGATLYRDIIDVNPPLVWYQALPSVVVARALDVSEITTFRIYIIALIAISLFLSNIVLGRLLEDEPAETRHILLFAIALFLTLWGVDFGQREHVMTILVMPYILLTAAVARGTRLSWPTAVAIGFCAGFGVALKPYFLLLPVLLELYLMAGSRRWMTWTRPEALTLGILVTAYIAFIAAFTPEYFTHMLPIGLEVYWAYNGEPASVFTALAWRVAIPLPVIVLLSAGRHRPVPQLQWVFGIAAAALAVSGVAQFKGWSYHVYPTFVVLATWALFLVATRLAVDAGQGRSIRWGRLGTVSLSAAVLVVPICITMLQFPVLVFGLGQYVRPVETWVTLIEEHAADDSIFAFSSKIAPMFPAVNYSGAEWASRSGALWMLPAVMRTRAAETGSPPAAMARLDEIEAYQRELVIEDLLQWRPALVFVDIESRKQAFRDIDLDYLEYFLSDPRFASLWSEYEELDRIHNFRVFRRRTPEDGDASSSAGGSDALRR